MIKILNSFIYKMKNFFLSCKEVKIEPTIPKTYYGCFYLGPFRESQALTVANALRRTLLTDIVGLAITSVKIEGINHEYSVLKGVRETTIDILLNLKNIVIQKTSESTIKQTQLGYLQARGPGIIRAKDLKLPPIFQCVNPDQYIATLSEDGQLILTFTIDEGRNFIFREQSQDLSKKSQTENSLKDSFLDIDSVFTPIKKVNYLIESYGSKNIYNKNQMVILEIWTNGSISPKDSLSQALNSLNLLFQNLGKLKVLNSLLTSYSLQKNQNFKTNFEMFDRNLKFLNFSFYKKNKFKNQFYKSSLEKITTNQKLFKSYVQGEFKEKCVNRKISELGLPFRILSLLYKSKILKIEELLNLNEENLKKILNFDDQLFFNLKEILKLNGLNFK